MLSIRQIIQALFWKYIERGLVQGLLFLVLVIMARYLGPSEYGTAVLAMSVMAVATAIVQNGFNIVLIQRQDIVSADYSYIFWLLFFLSFILCGIIYFLSPFLAILYNSHTLVSIIQIMILSLPFIAFNAVNNSILTRRMDFKKIFIINLMAMLISSFTGGFMLLCGYGIWSFVVQQILNIVCISFLMIVFVRWCPRLIFSWSRLKSLWGFGAKILLSSLLDTLYEQIYSLTIGKKYSTAQLSFFNKGQAFPRFIVVNIDSSIESVMLPTYSRCQNNRSELREVMRNTIILSSYFVFPLLTLLFCAAEAVVLLILSEEWLVSIVYIRIFCISLLLHPINTANIQAINATGRSGIVLKINIIKKAFALALLFFTVSHGVIAIASATIVNGILFAIINVFPNAKFMNYKLSAQILDILPNMLTAFAMGVVVYTINLIEIIPLFKICIQLFIGILFYVAVSYISHNKAFEMMKMQYLRLIEG